MGSVKNVLGSWSQQTHQRWSNVDRQHSSTLFQRWHLVENESWADVCLSTLFERRQGLWLIQSWCPSDVSTLIFGCKWKLSRPMFIGFASALRKQHWNNLVNDNSVFDNTRQHEFNTTQHNTTRVQHDTTQVKHEVTRVQYLGTQVQLEPSTKEARAAKIGLYIALFATELYIFLIPF